MELVYVKNEYFSYLIGLGGGRNAVEFFTDTENKYSNTKNERYGDILIKSYSISEYDSFETHYLLGLWISKALDMDFKHSYNKVNQEKLDIIYSKKNYKSIEQSVIDEIKRVYKETQSFLDKAFPESEYVLLYRVLNHIQEEQFDNNHDISFNFITSYMSLGSHGYPGARTGLWRKVNKKNILAFTNLSNNGITLSELEDEVIVVHPDHLWMP